MVAVASYVTISLEEAAHLGLGTFVEEEELTAARARHKAKTDPGKPLLTVNEEDFAAFTAWKAKADHEAVIAAAVSDAVLFNELDPLLEAVREEEAPQPIQDPQEQAPEAEEASEAPAAVEGAKPGRRGR
jgi:hypothetical protein